MDFVNAIAKVRFASARPQRVALCKGESLTAELLCMEPGQKAKIETGEWTYYVITGTAVLKCGGQTSELPTGGFASCGAKEPHSLTGSGDQRLICLAIGHVA